MGTMWMNIAPVALASTETMAGRLLGFDAQFLFDVAVSAVNMFVLFFALSYFLFDPVRTMLNKRQEKIRTDIETAESDRQQAQAMKAEYEAKLSAADKEVEEILSSARKKALKAEEEIIAEAKAEAETVKERANADIELEKKKALDDMKQEMISIASLMAGKVVSASINTEVQDELVEETMKEIGEQTWQS